MVHVTTESLVLVGFISTRSPFRWGVLDLGLSGLECFSR